MPYPRRPPPPPNSMWYGNPLSEQRPTTNFAPRETVTRPLDLEAMDPQKPLNLDELEGPDSSRGVSRSQLLETPLRNTPSEPDQVVQAYTEREVQLERQIKEIQSVLAEVKRRKAALLGKGKPKK